MTSSVRHYVNIDVIQEINCRRRRRRGRGWTREAANERVHGVVTWSASTDGAGQSEDAQFGDQQETGRRMEALERRRQASLHRRGQATESCTHARSSGLQVPPQTEAQVDPATAQRLQRRSRMVSQRHHQDYQFHLSPFMPYMNPGTVGSSSIFQGGASIRSAADSLAAVAAAAAAAAAAGGEHSRSAGFLLPSPIPRPPSVGDQSLFNPFNMPALHPVKLSAEAAACAAALRAELCSSMAAFESIYSRYAVRSPDQPPGARRADDQTDFRSKHFDFSNRLSAFPEISPISGYAANLQRSLHPFIGLPANPFL